MACDHPLGPACTAVVDVPEHLGAIYLLYRPEAGGWNRSVKGNVGACLASVPTERTGLSVRPGLCTMLHAPETGREVIEEPLSARRLGQLVAARRWR